MPRYFPSVRIRSSRGNVTIVEMHVILAKRRLVMMTKHVIHYPDMHEIFVIGGDVKGSHIIYRYESVPEGTKITVDARIKLGIMMRIAGFFTRNNIQEGLENITKEFAILVEG